MLVDTASYCTSTEGSFLGIRRPERVNNHSLSPSVFVRISWSYLLISTPSCGWKILLCLHVYKSPKDFRLKYLYLLLFFHFHHRHMTNLLLSLSTPKNIIINCAVPNHVVYSIHPLVTLLCSEFCYHTTHSQPKYGLSTKKLNWRRPLEVGLVKSWFAIQYILHILCKQKTYCPVHNTRLLAKQSSPCTDLDRPSGVAHFEAPRF